MGIFLVPISPIPPREDVSAVDRLRGLRQDGRPLERYVVEFSELVCLVNWPDAPLNAFFLMGLDEDTIRYIEPACSFSLVESINLILFLNGSDFEIEEVQEKTCLPRPVPSEKYAAWSVHPQPVSSTYPSSGSAHFVLPVPKPKPPKKMAAATSKPRHKMAATKPKPPRKMAAAVPEPQGKMADAAPGPQCKMATAKPEPSLLSVPTPVPLGLLVEYKGMSGSPTPDPAPVVHEPAPFLQEPAPVVHEPAPVVHEPAPAHEPLPTHEPAPFYEPFLPPLKLPKKPPEPPRHPTAPDSPRPPEAPEPPRPPEAPEPPRPPKLLDPPWRPPYLSEPPPAPAFRRDEVAPKKPRPKRVERVQVTVIQMTVTSESQAAPSPSGSPRLLLPPRSTIVLRCTDSTPVCQAHVSTSVKCAFSSTVALQVFSLVSSPGLHFARVHLTQSGLAPPYIGFTMGLHPGLARGHPLAPPMSTLAPPIIVST
ncbi:hypothetical protein DPX16_6067 [Anabarilius grahami]|uniref:Uncharacterized protein n=1 Tax=Anabarilius grahami TaxID=495550 RepID=A0A3N0Z168_ANAGA|nr:hypothetical protein DPX16_6067 [Anabarilius grahami]